MDDEPEIDDNDRLEDRELWGDDDWRPEQDRYEDWLDRFLFPRG